VTLPIVALVRWLAITKRHNLRVEMKLPSKTSGFTLIEVIVGVVIMGIIFSIGVAKYGEFNRSQIVEQAALDLKNNLRLAQNRAFSGQKDADICGDPAVGDTKPLDGWYVSFTNNSYQIYGQCGGDPFSQATVDLSIKKVTIVSPLPSTIRFKPLGQGVENEGTITLLGSGGSRTVSVTATGEIR